ncbi:MAG TPA: hypothetical protein VFD83_01535, partial [Candidatus Polarisedimenticolia bacterium]|nr:hypothetical protein [Candidatus Polarisedimenticolia bacterium]
SNITTRTDVFALGLLTYEMFTGKQPVPGTRPSGIDPTIDALALRCLDPDPEKRPASAMEFLGALPGGDALDAALKAGETPSPEMVAAAGEDRALSAGRSWGLFGFGLLVAAAALLAGVYAIGLDSVPMKKSPEVLSERAREISRSLGGTVEPSSSEWWMGLAGAYASWSRTHPHALALAGTRPSVLRFDYRESPQPIYPWRNPFPTRSDPPMIHAGDSYVGLDLEGNVVDFTRVVRQLGPPDTSQASPPRWESLLAFTGIPAGELRAVPPQWTPDVPSDARAAWDVTGGRAPVRIEAATWKGQPVWLRTIEPWERAERDTRDSTVNPIGNAMFVGVVIAVLLAMGVLARHNLRVGRGDMRGAVRVAIAVLLGFGLSNAFIFRWTLEPDQIWKFMVRVPYFPALFIGLTYLGVEPFLRRRWPHRLIAWTRLLEGRWLDPLVGREALLGVLAGATSALAFWLPAFLEHHPDSDTLLTLLPFRRDADFWGSVVNCFPNGLMKGLGGFGLLLMVRFFVRRDWVAWIGLGLIILVTSILSWNMTPVLWIGLIVGTACLVLAARAGVVAAVTTFIVSDLIMACTPLTLDLSRWYAWRTGVIAFLLVAIAVWAFRAAMGRRKILSAAMLEG